MQDEKVLITTHERLGMWTWAALIMFAFATGGLSLLWLCWWARRTLTLTDRRVIVCRGLLWKTEKAIPLRNIQHVDVTFGPLAAHIRIQGAGFTSFTTFGPIPVWTRIQGRVRLDHGYVDPPRCLEVGVWRLTPRLCP